MCIDVCECECVNVREHDRDFLKCPNLKSPMLRPLFGDRSTSLGFGLEVTLSDPPGGPMDPIRKEGGWLAQFKGSEVKNFFQ